MLSIKDILETNRMISENNLYVRTITMGISLRDCAHPDLDRFCQNVYEKITRRAEHLVRTGEEIESEYQAELFALETLKEINKKAFMEELKYITSSKCLDKLHNKNSPHLEAYKRLKIYYRDYLK